MVLDLIDTSYALSFLPSLWSMKRTGPTESLLRGPCQVTPKSELFISLLCCSPIEALHSVVRHVGQLKEPQQKLGTTCASEES